MINLSIVKRKESVLIHLLFGTDEQSGFLGISKTELSKNGPSKKLRLFDKKLRVPQVSEKAEGKITQISGFKRVKS